jgi:hypothetical protein
MSSLDAEAPSGIEVGALGLSQPNAGTIAAAHSTAIETILFILFSPVN